MGQGGLGEHISIGSGEGGKGMLAGDWRRTGVCCARAVTHGLCVGVITDTLVITELRGVRVVQIP